jgi:hypothetical protein
MNQIKVSKQENNDYFPYKFDIFINRYRYWTLRADLSFYIDESLIEEIKLIRNSIFELDSVLYVSKETFKANSWVSFKLEPL